MRTLRVVLYVLSVIEGLGGLALLFASGWLLSFGIMGASNPALVVLMKALGIIAIAFGYLLCVTARDPVRFVPVIDTLIFLLFAVAGLNLYALIGLDAGAFFPAGYLVARVVVQVLLGVWLIVLRPKGVSATSRA